MNIIECTIKMKAEARAHYERLANAFDDKELKRLFTLLAAAEEEHRALLEKINDRVHPSEDDLAALEASVCVFRPTLDSANPVKTLRRDPDAYRHVIADEQETIELFDQLASQADNEKLKKLCRILANQERRHLKMVENIYAFVEDPRTYLEWGEFGNLGRL